VADGARLSHRKDEELTNLIVVVTGWLLGWWAFGRPRTVDRLQHPAPPVDGRRVSVVVPARNEATSLPLLLADLATARPAGAEVVVVDDHSTDGTARLAAEFDFVTVVPAPPLPPGWTGKPWACATGAATAKGDVLVFLDADVRLDDGALDRVLAVRDERGGLVSVQPWHTPVRPYERLSALFNVIALMGIGAGGRRPPTGAFGPVMVTSRQDYERAGGHAGVHDKVVEDVALAATYRQAGLPVETLAGERSVRFRMYPDGPRSMVQGWTKNFVTGAGSTAPLRLGGIVVWVTALGASLGVLFDGLSGDLPLLLFPAVYACFVGQLTWMFRRTGSFGVPTALVYPLLMAFFALVFARSAWRTYVRRSVTWRGRAVPVGATRS
jgi:4,4'-diaponeurosporenoate glycosyltransferase